MVALSDQFTRPNTTAGAGLGSIPGGPAWQIFGSTVARISSNRADLGTGAAGIAVVDAGGGGKFDVTTQVASGGGDAVYARVTDASNWLRARVNVITTFTTQTS